MSSTVGRLAIVVRPSQVDHRGPIEQVLRQQIATERSEDEWCRLLSRSSDGVMALIVSATPGSVEWTSEEASARWSEVVRGAFGADIASVHVCSQREQWAPPNVGPGVPPGRDTVAFEIPLLHGQTAQHVIDAPGEHLVEGAIPGLWASYGVTAHYMFDGDTFLLSGYDCHEASKINEMSREMGRMLPDLAERLLSIQTSRHPFDIPQEDTFLQILEIGRAGVAPV